MLRGLRRRLAVIFTLFTGAVLLGVLGISLWNAVQQAKLEQLSSFSYRIDSLSSDLMNMGEEYVADAQILVEQPYLTSVLLGDVALQTDATWSPATPTARLYTEARAQESVTADPMYGIAQDSGMLYFGTFDSQTGEMLPDGLYSGATMAAVEAAPAEEATGAAEAEAAEDGSLYVEAATPGTAAEAAADEGSYAITITDQLQVSTEGIFTLEGEGGERYRGVHFMLPVVQANGELSEAVYDVVLLESLELEERRILFLWLQYAALALLGLGLLVLVNWLLAGLVLKPTEENWRRQADFVAAASHELRSPLAVVRSSLSAAEVSESEAEAARYRRTAEAEAVRMSRLVDDLLLLAGGDAGSWSLERGSVELDTLLLDASEGFAPLAREKDITLAVELPEETLPPVQGDRDRLAQILAVLLDNALQYAPAGSRVVLSAEAARKGRVRLRVADSGPGLPAEGRERIFDRFYRADAARGDKKHFGLGLSVARELAELHGGKLAAEETPGGGATFVLTLPAVKAKN